MTFFPGDVVKTKLHQAHGREREAVVVRLTPTGRVQLRGHNNRPLTLLPHQLVLVRRAKA